VKNSPGFVVNRILVPDDQRGLLRAAGRAWPVAEDIDAGMKLGCNQPIGPLALADMIGLDTMLAVMEVFYEGFNDPSTAPARCSRKWWPPATWAARPAAASRPRRTGWSGSRPAPAFARRD
jgi:3-hydroxyacyl-CoA dehydrogenase